MVSPAPILPFLRPLGPPRPSTFRQFFSTSRQLLQAGPSPGETASSTKPPSLPSQTPKPPQSSPSKRAPQPSQTPSANLLPYHVKRTWTGNLPVYEEAKRGGNLHQTKIRHVIGNAGALKLDVTKWLKIKEEKLVRVNSVNNDIVVKGWHKKSMEEFLKSKGF